MSHPACRTQDFEKAGQLRDKEMELKAQITAITAGAKESGEAEQEAEGGGGPLVQESDIANIVSQWTGIPIEKVGRWSFAIGAIMLSAWCSIWRSA